MGVISTVRVGCGLLGGSFDWPPTPAKLAPAAAGKRPAPPADPALAGFVAAYQSIAGHPPGPAALAMHRQVVAARRARLAGTAAVLGLPFDDGLNVVRRGKGVGFQARQTVYEPGSLAALEGGKSLPVRLADGTPVGHAWTEVKGRFVNFSLPATGGAADLAAAVRAGQSVSASLDAVREAGTPDAWNRFRVTRATPRAVVLTVGSGGGGALREVRVES